MKASMNELNILEIASKHMWALRVVEADGDGPVDLTATHACMLLALRELDLYNVVKSATSPMALELDDLETYIAANYPEQYESPASLAEVAIKLLQDQSTMIKARTDRIWELEAEAANFQGLLDLAYARPGAFGGAPQVSEPAGVIAVNGDGGHSTEVLGWRLEPSPEQKSDLLWAATAQLATEAARLSTTAVVDDTAPIPVDNQCDHDDGIDWQGLPAEYHDTIVGLVGWHLEWSKLPMAARRSIALYAIAWMAGEDGTLTMAQFESRKPGWMPSAGAIAQMFNHRWSEVMKSALAHARVES